MSILGLQRCLDQQYLRRGSAEERFDDRLKNIVNFVIDDLVQSRQTFRSESYHTKCGSFC